MSIYDLKGITPEKLKEAISCLESLLTNKDDSGKLAPIITGYNWYNQQVKGNPAFTLYHIHSSDAYKGDMFEDLHKAGYSKANLETFIRNKAGAFLWEPEFRITDDSGIPYPGLIIRDALSGKYLDMASYKKPLIYHPESLNTRSLIAEDHGWELNIPFQDKVSLLRLVELFEMKSGKYRYDENGAILTETEDEKFFRTPWNGAYETPVILIGKAAITFEEYLPSFVRARRFSLNEGSDEISFIINKKFHSLECSKHYSRLLDIGFCEEPCLGNKKFIKEYIDKDR